MAFLGLGSAKHGHTPSKVATGAACGVFKWLFFSCGFRLSMLAW
jgi:hypothetical protein